MRGSIVRRKGKQGDVFYVVVRNRWYRVDDPQTKTHAQAFQARLLAELERGGYVQPQRITVAAFVERWQAAKWSDLSPNTVYAYETALKQMIIPAFGSRLLGSITREDCEAWRAELSTRYAPYSISPAMICMRQLYGAAIDWGYLAVSPMVRVKHRVKRQREINPLSPDQLRQLLEITTDPRWRAIILLATTGGLRQGEVGAARWANLDLEARTYLVTETLIGHPRDGQVIRPPKSAASRAKVLLSPACCQALQAHRAAQLERLLAKGLAGDDEGWMFAWPGSGYPYLSTMTYQWAQVLKRAGLPHVRFHDLRHTCAALLVDVAAHPKVIQQQLRHSTISITLDIYGHLFPQRVDEAVAAIDDRLGLG